MLRSSPEAPLFEDEVNEPLHRLFAALEVVPYADTTVSCDDGPADTAPGLLVHWFVSGREEADEALAGLRAAGATSFAALILDDEGGTGAVICREGRVSQVTTLEGRKIGSVARRLVPEELVRRLELAAFVRSDD